MSTAAARGDQRPSLEGDGLLVLSAPTQVRSAQDGTMAAHAAHGLFHGGWRYASRIELLVDGVPVESVATTEEPEWTLFRCLAVDAGSRHVVPRVAIERMRRVHSGGMVERVTLVNGRDEPVEALVEVACDLEFAPLEMLRAGGVEPVAITIEPEGDEAIATDGTRTLRAGSRGGSVRIEGNRVIVAQRALVAPGDWAGVALELDVIDPTLPMHGAVEGLPCEALRPSGRPALDRWAARALPDLDSLLLDAGSGAFPAAGAPWRMTMVAHDVLVASRLLLPLGTGVAEGTLRTLAARQGVQRDHATGEEPGRILHEMRQRTDDRLRPGVEAHPRYTGSIDATPLWIVLLHDAWQAGMPLETVRELRTVLHAALGWMEARSSSGFLASREETGMGLAGDGREDDEQGMRIEGQRGVASARVQALACRAAMGAARVLDALGDDGDPWRAWAERLRGRFRERFWVERGGVRFPAMALDARGLPFETLTSDIGQLVGTTLLSRAEEVAVARLLLDGRLSSGFGLRSMAVDEERYWPFSASCGAVWPHDTAIAIEGLLRAGLDDEARRLAEQLERAADAFDGRMPEVYAGYGVDEAASPVLHPDAGAMQARSAASVVPVHLALSGASALRPCAPEPRLTALTPPSATSALEPVEINAGRARPRSRARLRLVPTSVPAP